MLVAPDSVIVARDVHVGKSVLRLPVAGRKGRAELHEAVSHQAGQRVVELAADGFLLLAVTLRFFGLVDGLFRFVVAVDAKSHGIEEVEENIDAAGHRPCGIQAVQVLCHLSCKRNALLLRSLRDLIAGGIHDDTGVIVIFVHHLTQVRLPPLAVDSRVVIFGLVDIPAVHELVHHQHSQTVAGFEHGLGNRIVCGADRVVSVLHEDPDPSLFCFRICTCAENSVVVVNAGAAKDHTLTVDRHTFTCFPLQSPDAEGLLHDIFPKGHAAGVEIGSLGAPELSVLHTEAESHLCALAVF